MNHSDERTEFERGDTAGVVAALLVFLARSDGHISQVEIDTMIDRVAQHFQLKSAEALQRVRVAMLQDNGEPDLSQTLRNRVRLLSSGEKREILVMLLEVAGADGVQQAEEIRAIDIAVELIDLPAEDVHAAYQAYFARQSS